MCGATVGFRRLVRVVRTTTALLATLARGARNGAAVAGIAAYRERYGTAKAGYCRRLGTDDHSGAWRPRNASCWIGRELAPRCRPCGLLTCDGLQRPLSLEMLSISSRKPVADTNAVPTPGFAPGLCELPHTAGPLLAASDDGLGRIRLGGDTCGNRSRLRLR